MKWAFLTLGVLHNEGLTLFLKLEGQNAMEVGIHSMTLQSICV